MTRHRWSRVCSVLLALLVWSAASGLLWVPALQAQTGNLRSQTTYTNQTPVIVYGQVADGTGQVTALDTAPGATIDGGTISFVIDNITVCTLPINGTQQQCPPTAGAGLHAGVHTIYAAYSGNQYYAPSQSDVSTVTVQPAPTNFGLLSRPDPSLFGQQVTVTATAGAQPLPLGTFTLLDGSTPIFTAALNGSGQAVYTTSGFSVGQHLLTGRFDLTPDFFSGSLQVTQIVKEAGPVGYTLSAAPATPDVRIGVSNSVRITVTPFGGFAEPVVLSCSGMPAESTCSFPIATVPAGGGSVALLLTPASPHPCNSSQPYGPRLARRSGAGIAILAGLCLCGAVGLRRRSLRGICLLCIAAVTLPLLNGCGNCTDLGVRPGKYTVRVTGTSSGVTHTIVTLQVPFTATL